MKESVDPEPAPITPAGTELASPDMKESVDPEPAPITPAGTELASPRQENELDDGSETDTSQLAQIGKAVAVKMQEIGRPLTQSQNYKK